MIASEKIRLSVGDPEGSSPGVLGQKIRDDSKVLVMRKPLLLCLEDLT